MQAESDQYNKTTNTVPHIQSYRTFIVKKTSFLLTVYGIFPIF